MNNPQLLHDGSSVIFRTLPDGSLRIDRQETTAPDATGLCYRKWAGRIIIAPVSGEITENLDFPAALVEEATTICQSLSNNDTQ